MAQGKKTQTSEILNYLRKHKRGITSWEAFERFGATRLSAIIFALRKRGYRIASEDKVVRTRYGRNVTVSRYYLVND